MSCYTKSQCLALAHYDLIVAYFSVKMNAYFWLTSEYSLNVKKHITYQLFVSTNKEKISQEIKKREEILKNLYLLVCLDQSVKYDTLDLWSGSKIRSYIYIYVYVS